MKTTSVTLLAALAFGVFAPTLAAAQPAGHAAHTAETRAVQNKAAVKTTRAKAQKKVTCRYQMQKGRKVRVCR
ncbi:hypothetical protein V474_23690 [Novosphingobium barchaimii LL02]|uniref:Uncharacterized protein n=1 Tax=Novosphingobium barchaimii LL02 TaxID=1114963 RepID=A0A0J7XPC4_9SPHN|nr:hypothetical protein [Novosphingobium barchaimii]KMS52928.1 hypothetical protein V474_23690 [Novosphingobium barchaimii LL02]